MACSYSGCHETKKKGNVVHFFPVNDSQLCSKWVHRSGNLKLLAMPSSLLRKKYLCSKHFRKSNVTKTVLPYSFKKDTKKKNDKKSVKVQVKRVGKQDVKMKRRTVSETKLNGQKKNIIAKASKKTPSKIKKVLKSSKISTHSGLKSNLKQKKPRVNTNPSKKISKKFSNARAIGKRNGIKPKTVKEIQDVKYRLPVKKTLSLKKNVATTKKNIKLNPSAKSSAVNKRAGKKLPMDSATTSKAVRKLGIGQEHNSKSAEKKKININKLRMQFVSKTNICVKVKKRQSAQKTKPLKQPVQKLKIKMAKKCLMKAQRKRVDSISKRKSGMVRGPKTNKPSGKSKLKLIKKPVLVKKSKALPKSILMRKVLVKKEIIANKMVKPNVHRKSNKSLSSEISMKVQKNKSTKHKSPLAKMRTPLKVKIEKSRSPKELRSPKKFGREGGPVVKLSSPDPKEPPVSFLAALNLKPAKEVLLLSQRRDKNERVLRRNRKTPSDETSAFWEKKKVIKVVKVSSKSSTAQTKLKAAKRLLLNSERNRVKSLIKRSDPIVQITKRKLLLQKNLDDPKMLKTNRLIMTVAKSNQTVQKPRQKVENKLNTTENKRKFGAARLSCEEDGYNLELQRSDTSTIETSPNTNQANILKDLLLKTGEKRNLTQFKKGKPSIRKTLKINSNRMANSGGKSMLETGKRSKKLSLPTQKNLMVNESAVIDIEGEALRALEVLAKDKVDRKVDNTWLSVAVVGSPVHPTHDNSKKLDGLANSYGELLSTMNKVKYLDPALNPIAAKQKHLRFRRTALNLQDLEATKLRSDQRQKSEITILDKLNKDTPVGDQSFAAKRKLEEVGRPLRSRANSGRKVDNSWLSVAVVKSPTPKSESMDRSFECSTSDNNSAINRAANLYERKHLRSGDQLSSRVTMINNAKSLNKASVNDLSVSTKRKADISQSLKKSRMTVGETWVSVSVGGESGITSNSTRSSPQSKPSQITSLKREGSPDPSVNRSVSKVQSEHEQLNTKEISPLRKSSRKGYPTRKHDENSSSDDVKSQVKETSELNSKVTENLKTSPNRSTGRKIKPMNSTTDISTMEQPLSEIRRSQRVRKVVVRDIADEPKKKTKKIVVQNIVEKADDDCETRSVEYDASTSEDENMENLNLFSNQKDQENPSVYHCTSIPLETSMNTSSSEEHLRFDAQRSVKKVYKRKGNLGTTATADTDKDILNTNVYHLNGQTIVSDGANVPTPTIAYQVPNPQGGPPILVLNKIIFAGPQPAPGTQVVFTSATPFTLLPSGCTASPPVFLPPPPPLTPYPPHIVGAHKIPSRPAKPSQTAVEEYSNTSTDWSVYIDQIYTETESTNIVYGGGSAAIGTLGSLGRDSEQNEVIVDVDYISHHSNNFVEEITLSSDEEEEDKTDIIYDHEVFGTSEQSVINKYEEFPAEEPENVTLSHLTSKNAKKFRWMGNPIEEEQGSNRSETSSPFEAPLQSPKDEPEKDDVEAASLTSASWKGSSSSSSSSSSSPESSDSEEPERATRAKNKRSAPMVRTSHYQSDNFYMCTACRDPLREVMTEEEIEQQKCGTFDCSICGAMFYCRYHLDIHKCLHDYNHKCESCTLVFKTERMLDVHRRYRHMAARDRFNCRKCHMRFSCDGVYNKHADSCYGRE